MHEVDVLIITGLSGAGKTQAIRVFEDLGYFCVDNLPPALIPKFTELCFQSRGKVNKVALVIDIRGRLFFDDLFEALGELKASGVNYEILFLEASNEVLIKRFKETRRRHPLNPQGGVIEGIEMERGRLQDLKGRADKIIDTSNLAANQLKEAIRSTWGKKGRKKGLAITVMSFGYKYGIPLDTDLLMDVRFLPNPYYVSQLQNLPGTNKDVNTYVLNSKESRQFLQKYYDLLRFVIPNYIKEGKAHLVIAIGCTGGRHRSVVLAEELKALLVKEGYQITVKHRDIEK